jgi:hypothetical protein
MKVSIIILTLLLRLIIISGSHGETSEGDNPWRSV